MILPEDEEFLAHYGVKGMRWGVRRSGGYEKKKKNRVVLKAAVVAGGIAFLNSSVGREIMKTTVSSISKSLTNAYFPL